MKSRNLNLSQETLSYLDNMDKITGGTSTHNSSSCGTVPLGTSCTTLDSKCLTTFKTYQCDPKPVQDVPCRKYTDSRCG